MESTEIGTSAAGRVAAVVGPLWQTYKRRVLIVAAAILAASTIYGVASFFSDARAFVCGESQKEDTRKDTSADEYY
jgi:hypothetical protein